MLSVLLWWLVIQVIGLAGLPLVWQLMARLPGRGYPFAKALGLLLVSYVLWVGASFRLLPNDLGGSLVALAVVGSASAWIGRAGLAQDTEGHRPLLDWLRDNRALVIATELLFLLVFGAWAAFRAFNPDISGTEKPMELAFINGVLNSRFFPPQDPWLSGFGISYYYFGYVMLSVLVRLTGVLPEVGFNLGVALWFALVMISAFGVLHALVGLAPRRSSSRDQSSVPAERHDRGRAISWGMVGALFVGVLGNLEGILDSAYHRRLLPARFTEWIDIKGLTQSQPTGDWTGGFWWWWRASRVIHDKDLLGNTVEVIDEFPFFSFLLGDMHPHVLAYPFVFLAMALALNLLLGARDALQSTTSVPTARLPDRMRVFGRALGDMTGIGAWGVAIYAVVLGGLAFLNTWDFPVYVALAALALALGVSLRRGIDGHAVRVGLAGGATFGVLGWLLYAPFYIGFQSQLGGILPNLLFPSRFSQYFLMFGTFLVSATLFLALQTWRLRSRETLRGSLVAFGTALLGPVLLFALIAFSMSALPSGRVLAQSFLSDAGVKATIGAQTVGEVVRLVAGVRLAAPWTFVTLALLSGWSTGIIWAQLRVPRHATESGATFPVAPDLFAILLILLALILTFVPEFLYLRDLFGSRMNTVFKLYYQAWAMLGVAAAYGLSRLVQPPTPRPLAALSISLVGVLALAGLWYPALAIPSKADYFRGEPTLNGLEYLRRFSAADMAAVEWLRMNVSPDAVVLEASGGSYSTEGAGCVSMSTGNPTLLGWDFHERQWRGSDGYDELARGRPEALASIYRTAPAADLPALLEQWDIDYVYVGALERTKYGVGDVAEERFDSILKRVYDQDGVRIYAR